MRKLYKFYWDCGRQGDICGLFVADEQEVNDALGKKVYFGEVLGKFSEIYGTLEEKDLTVKTDDQEFIEKLESVIGDKTISGHNPLHHIDQDDEDGECEEDDDSGE